MSGFRAGFLSVIAGERKLNEIKKYQITGIVLALVHFIFMCQFLALDIRVMFFYNFVVVLFYSGIAIWTGRISRHTSIFIATFIEIMLHSILASVMLGWDWGFMIYTLGLVPVSFYIAYTVDYITKKLLVPGIASLTVFFSFFAVREINSHHGPFLDMVFSERVVHGAYLFNVMITFFLLWIVSFLFSIEVYYMQHNLENENISLEKLANYDPLTKLLNRRSMDEYMDEAGYRAHKKHEKFCIIMGDVDDFKRINDNYGHAAGDKVLIEVADIISKEVRDNDKVCRWGGEEIVILIRGDISKAKSVAWRICRHVADNIIDVGNGITIRASMTIGVAEYIDGEDIEKTVDRADQCMYNGKLRGKNRVVCEK